MKKFLLFLLVGFGLLSVSCQRPYDVPEFVDIKPNQTAFLIPITGKTESQQKFASVEFLESKKVATKRVQIPHEWVQTDRNANVGKYMPTVALIVVDRTPVSVSWLSTSGDKKIGVETLESTGLSVGVTVSAMIEEANASTFLYRYNSMSLMDAVNTDVNAYVKSQFAFEIGKLNIDQLKARKGEIFTLVEKNTREFFKPYGITVNQLGFTEGLVYDDKNLQIAIDAQTLLTIENANLKQKQINAVIENATTVAEAKATAEAESVKARLEAENEAYKAKIAASTVATQKALADIEIRKLYAQAAYEFAKNSEFSPSVISNDVLKSFNVSGFVDSSEKK